jgi:probable rRNA maturation factor
MAVEITCTGSAKKVSLRRFKRWAETILKLLHQDRVELSLALVDNQAIQELNARYREKDGPTDVLSFPSGERLPTGTKLLGDIVISVEQARMQARRRGKSLDEEVESLLIHGILHLLGYDHERSNEEARIMRKMERKIHRALCGRRDLAV